MPAPDVWTRPWSRWKRSARSIRCRFSLPASEVFLRFFRRELDDALAAARQALELHPYLPLSRVLYAQALEFSGDTEEALKQYRLATVLCPDLPWLRALEAICLVNGGRRADALAILQQLEELRETEYVDAYFQAQLLHALGRKDEAFLELERAAHENSAALFVLDVDPRMDPLRTDPRFGASGTACSKMPRSAQQV